MACGGIGHVDQFGFVRRRHNNHIGQGREIGDVERSRVRAAIGADQTGAVDGEAHGQVLDRHVMHDLIIGALQEGRINRAEGTHALRCEACRKGDAMLFGNADVKAAVGMRLREFIDARARGHGGCDRAYGWIRIGKLGQGFAEHILIGRWAATWALVLLAGDDVEFDNTMIFVSRRFGRGIALTLLCDDMDQHGAFRIVADIFENGNELIQIVAVDGADIVKAQLFKKGAAHGHATGIFFCLGRSIVDTARKLPGQLAREAA